MKFNIIEKIGYQIQTDGKNVKWMEKKWIKKNKSRNQNIQDGNDKWTTFRNSFIPLYKIW